MSAQMTPATARVVDPINTAIARGYKNDLAKIANLLFPIVRVVARAGRIIVFGPDDYVLMDTRRAPGEDVKRIQYGYADGTYGLVDHALEGLVPQELREEGQAVPGIDLGAVAINNVQGTMDREREYQASVLARDPTKYPADHVYEPSVGDRWDSDGSDPFKQIQDARLKIRSKIGRMPDLVVLGPRVAEYILVHPAVLGRLGNAEIKIATLQHLELMFKCKVVIGEEVSADPDTKVFSDMWGNDVILAYTTPKSLQAMGSPSFGYTYQLANYPVVYKPYWWQPKLSWIYPVTDAYQVHLVGNTSGYLIRGAVSSVPVV